LINALHLGQRSFSSASSFFPANPVSNGGSLL
jgi:hypothetical protein